MFKGPSLKSHLALFTWSIVDPISNLWQMFKGTSPFKPFVGSFLLVIDGPIYSFVANVQRPKPI
jgi:hypothetical protein